MARGWGFFERFRGVGGLPPALRARFEPEGIVFVAERVGVRQRFSGSIPGRHDGLAVSRHKGLLVGTRTRLYAAVPTMPRLDGPAIDQPWLGTSGPAKVTIDAAGVTLHIALKRVDPRFSGETTTTWKHPFTDDELAALPARTLSFDVSPAFVFASLGVRAKP